MDELSRQVEYSERKIGRLTQLRLLDQTSVLEDFEWKRDESSSPFRGGKRKYAEPADTPSVKRRFALTPRGKDLLVSPAVQQTQKPALSTSPFVTLQNKENCSHMDVEY